MKVVSRTLLFICIMLLSGCDNNRESKRTEYLNEIQKRKSNDFSHFPATDETIDGTFNKKQIYVPVYSHIFLSEDRFLKLSIMLSIRNTDLSKDLYVESIDYYNTEGSLVRQYISKPHILKPMATIEYYVDLEDMSGGTGANFIVNIASKDKTSLPIVQAVMTNIGSNNSLTFLTQGHIIE